MIKEQRMPKNQEPRTKNQTLTPIRRGFRYSALGTRYSSLASRLAVLRPTSRWQRALLLLGAVALLALASARLGRGLGTRADGQLPAQAVAPATPTAAAAQATAAAPISAPAPAPTPDGGQAGAPTAAPADTGDAAATWPVRLTEAFDQPSPAFPEVLGDKWWSRYHDGGYELQVAGRPSISYSSPLAARDFGLAADVQVPRGRAGLFFLLGRPNDFYRFLIDSDGRYRLEMQQVGASQPLIDWTASDALRRGERAVNQIAVQRQGDTLTLFANGVRLASFTLPAGNTLEARIGLALDAPDGEHDGQAWFDNLVVRAPDGH
jgi:hypothetical protein